MIRKLPLLVLLIGVIPGVEHTSSISAVDEYSVVQERPISADPGDTIRNVVDGYFGTTAVGDDPSLLSIVTSQISAALIEEAKLTSSDVIAADRFGFSVAMDGDRALIGAHLANTPTDNDAGAAYVFVRSGSSWTEEAKLTGRTGHAAPNSGNFGQSVFLQGDLAVVGAPFDDTSVGAAYVFVRTGSTWSTEEVLFASDGAFGDQFGNSVSGDGDYLIIGAKFATVDGIAQRGAAYVFVRSGSSWTEQAKLTASAGKVRDSFGTSVAMSGATALIGAPNADTPPINAHGAVYVFERTASTWSEQETLTASDATTSAFFGTAVSMSDDAALIGALNVAGGAGAAYVFRRAASTWEEEVKLTAFDASPGDRFGASVSVDGDYAFVGAPFDDTVAGATSGSAYIFVRSGETWNLSEQLFASDADGSEQFGKSVSMSAGRALVGADMEDLPDAGNAGAAFVFSVATVAVENEPPASHFFLSSPYPNPAHLQANIQYTLEEPANTRLTLYDVLGREVALISSGRKPAGQYEDQLLVSNLPAGMYFVNLSVGQNQSAQRLLLVNKAFR